MKSETINLSEHFSLRELTKTRVNMENVPNEAQVENLKRLCRWLEQLRLRYNQMRNEKGEMSNRQSRFLAKASVTLRDAERTFRSKKWK